MELKQAIAELSKFRDFIATKPPTVSGRKMFAAIQTVLKEIERKEKDHANLSKL